MASKANKYCLNGDTIVVTGTIPGYSRDAFSRAVAAHGGFVASGITAATTILLVGEEPGEAKIEAAKAKIAKGVCDIQILSVPVFQYRYPAVFSAAPDGGAEPVSKAKGAGTGAAGAGKGAGKGKVAAGSGKAVAGSGKAAKKPAPAKKVPGAASAAGSGSGGGTGMSVVYLECHEGTANKFYRMELDGTTVTSTWGATGEGKPSSTQVKSFDSEAEALKFFTKTEQQKRGKGYEDA